LAPSARGVRDGNGFSSCNPAVRCWLIEPIVPLGAPGTSLPEDKGLEGPPPHDESRHSSGRPGSLSSPAGGSRSAVTVAHFCSFLVAEPGFGT
jgi:hypothetical protein